MALTVGESHDVNTLLDWILGIRRPDTMMSDEQLADQAQAAAGRLADKANKTLMAGLDLSRVNEAWSRVEACPWQEADPDGRQ
jgi:hypothetical protein